MNNSRMIEVFFLGECICIENTNTKLWKITVCFGDFPLGLINKKKKVQTWVYTLQEQIQTIFNK